MTPADIDEYVGAPASSRERVSRHLSMSQDTSSQVSYWVEPLSSMVM
jgi:hypothetical protein